MFGIIGCGNMAQAIIKGMTEKKIVEPSEMIVSRRNKEKLLPVQETYGINITTDNNEVVKKSDIILLAVKPQMLEGVIEEIKENIDETKLLITIAAGKTMKWYEEQFGKTIRLVRCMPNTPAFVSEGCTGFCVNQFVTAEDKEKVLKIFNSLGLAIEVTENMMDVVVGVSGSSPAYVFMFMEAMADAAVLSGMPRKQAYQFVAQAVLGSAKLMLQTGKHPGELKDMVCSPGGTTIEAVKILEEEGLRGVVMDATLGCIEKSKSL